MKLIHCADVHLDSVMTTNLDSLHARERKSELLSTFLNMVAYAKENGISAILIAGDLFDTKLIRVTTRNMVYAQIVEHPEIDFYYLQGNHEEDAFLNAIERIPENLHLFGSQWTKYSLGENRIITLTGVVLDEENNNRIYNELALDMANINIVTMHGQQSKYMVKDHAEIIHLEALKKKGIDYLALGHVHAYTRERLDARGIWCYSGCLEGRGFDECGEHGFVVLDIDEERKTITDTFVPFAQRKLIHISIDISACLTTADILDLVEKALGEADCPENSMVKVELTGTYDAEGEKDVDFVYSHIANRFYFTKMKDSSVYRIDYSEFENARNLKGEFIRTVQNDTTLTEEEKGLIIHYGIKALAGEEILQS